MEHGQCGYFLPGFWLILLQLADTVALILACYFNQQVHSSPALENKWVYEHRPRVDMGYLEGVIIQ